MNQFAPNTTSLEMFCAKSSTRYAIAAPFSVNGYHYATDGHWIARRKDDTSLKHDGQLPPCERLPGWAAEYKPDPLPMPLLKSMNLFIDCKKCCGSGQCTHCTGMCGACDGNGRVDSDRILGWEDGVFLKEFYVVQLANIGAQLFAPASGNVKHPVRFVAGDIEGLLMQCEPKGGCEYMHVGSHGILTEKVW